MIKHIVNTWFKYFPPETVKYWKTKEAELAKVTEENGFLEMVIKGEKYRFPGFPRGHLLFGVLSPLKHNIKVKVFNESWALKEQEETVVPHILTSLDEIITMKEEVRFNMLSPKVMSPAVKEVWRAWSTVEDQFPEHRKKLKALKEILCFIIQEDDAYRFRMQWMAKLWRRRMHPVKNLEYAMKMMQEAEVVVDMKLRVRLWRTIILIALKNPTIKAMFLALVQELDIKKLKLSKADKYYFRGKYFKVDYPLYEY